MAYILTDSLLYIGDDVSYIEDDGLIKINNVAYQLDMVQNINSQPRTKEPYRWKYKNNTWVDNASPETIKFEITEAVQQRLDDFAKTRNYDGILSACTYATSTVAQFASEGQLCVNLRDATWGKLYQVMAEVEAGERTMPTGYVDIDSELPELTWGTL